MWALVACIVIASCTLLAGVWAHFHYRRLVRRERRRGGLVDLTGVRPRLTPYNHQAEADFVTAEDIIDRERTG